MRKYVKPEIEIISFEVESSVMASPSPTADAYGTLQSSALSSTKYIPDSVDQKVWATVDDGENWNWQE